MFSAYTIFYVEIYLFLKLCLQTVLKFNLIILSPNSSKSFHTQTLRTTHTNQLNIYSYRRHTYFILKISLSKHTYTTVQSQHIQTFTHIRINREIQTGPSKSSSLVIINHCTIWLWSIILDKRRRNTNSNRHSHTKNSRKHTNLWQQKIFWKWHKVDAFKLIMTLSMQFRLTEWQSGRLDVGWMVVCKYVWREASIWSIGWEAAKRQTNKRNCLKFR